MADQRDDPKRFDPRFDPKFQPGYDVRNDSAAPARATTRFAPNAAQAGVQVTPVGSTAPIARAAPVTVPAVATESTLQPGRVGADVASDDRLGADTPSARQGRNPFVVALWIAAGVLMLAGVATAQVVRDLSLTTQTSPDPALTFTSVQILIALSPLLISLGIATAVGLLFLHATNWARRT